RKGRPLLSFGGLEETGSLILEKIEGRTIAFIPLLKGVINYEENIYGLLPTVAKALNQNLSHTRQLIQLHQTFHPETPRLLHPGEMLLVKTSPLHIRTVYAHVVNELLPPGIHHTSASFL